MPVQTSIGSFTCQESSFTSVYPESTDARSMAACSEPNSAVEKDHDSRGHVGLCEIRNQNLVEESYLRYTHHRDSLSSSGSTNSSPTTTASLLGSVSTSETPGTSPDTPASSQSIAYPSLSLAMHSGTDSKAEPRLPPLPTTKKARNLKNLALNTSNPLNLGRAVLNASLPLESPSETPLSASGTLSSNFVRPMSPPRRKGSALNLTIMTPTREASSPTQTITQVAATPKLVRPAALRQFQSTPSLPLLSAGLAPTGGMRLPTFTSQLADAPSEHEEDEQSHDYDIPQSREEMPAAYPDGPICIYDPHVYLYLEPSAEQASDYEVIFNVASEVQNPFLIKEDNDVPSKSLKTAADALRNHQSQIVDRASADVSKADKCQPEYIHVPWEHNTDIVPDLYDLVKVLDDRVQRGKRVLIHCQCGVSRSASLIVAYGIYKNPGMTVQQAYDAVKERSKWIGPNMNLIMQLQEFRSGLIKSNISSRQRSQTLASESVTGRQKYEENIFKGTGEAFKPLLPQTAPLLHPSSKHLPTPIRMESQEKVSLGPSSAPGDFHWPSGPQSTQTTPGSTEIPVGAPAPTLYVAPDGQTVQPQPAVVLNPTTPKKTTSKTTGAKLPRAYPAPLNLVTRSTSRQSNATPASSEFAMTMIQHTEVDPSFGITSPRTADFVGHPAPARSLQPQPQDSPRSTTFAMTPVQPIELADTAMLGLTSPRVNTFAAKLPQRLSQFNPARSVEARPREEKVSPHSRPHLRQAAASVAVGAELLMSPRAAEFTQSPFHNVLDAQSPRATNFTDAPMSPQATEFMGNPLHEALAAGPSSQRVRASTVGHAPRSPRNLLDPRSPPLRGASPIVRDIFDVL